MQVLLDKMYEEDRIKDVSCDSSLNFNGHFLKAFLCLWTIEKIATLLFLVKHMTFTFSKSSCFVLFHQLLYQGERFLQYFIPSRYGPVKSTEPRQGCKYARTLPQYETLLEKTTLHLLHIQQVWDSTCILIFLFCHRSVVGYSLLVSFHLHLVSVLQFVLFTGPSLLGMKFSVNIFPQFYCSFGGGGSGIYSLLLTSEYAISTHPQVTYTQWHSLLH